MSDPYAMFDPDDEPEPDYDPEPQLACPECLFLSPVGATTCHHCGWEPPADDDPNDLASGDAERRADDVLERP